jgi:hypothetical protein
VSDLDGADLPPDAAFATARLVVTAYVREDGTNGYAVACSGDAPMTTYLGLTVIAQEHIKEWGAT